MKKILITLLLTVFSFALFAQEPELSDYEKYHMEKEAEMLGETTVPDTIHDTVYVVVEQEAEPVIINNYNGYNEPNYRFLLTFGYGYHYSGYYDPWYYGYNYYDPWYYDYYGYNRYYGSYYYPYWGHNRYYSSYYYGHNFYNYGYYSRPRGQRYATSNALGRNKNYYRPYNKTYSSGYAAPSTASKKNAYTRPSTTKQVATTRTQNSRTNG